LVRAGKITGLAIRNLRNERLANVDGLVVDLPSGRLPEVILASTGFLGAKGELTAVPPQAFYFEPEYNALILIRSIEASTLTPKPMQPSLSRSPVKSWPLTGCPSTRSMCK
jgi:hypothetical protein